MVYGLPAIGEASWGQKVNDSIEAVKADVDEGFADSGWLAPTLLNSWVNYGGAEQVAQYRKLGKRVHLRGLIKTGAIGSSAFALPVGYRPSSLIRLSVASNSAFGMVNVGTDGVVLPLVGSSVWVSLDGISFLVD